MFKGLGDLAKIGSTLGKLQSLQEDLKEKRVSGAAGGGLVEVEANGAGEVLKVRIAPPLLVAKGEDQRADGEVIEDLLPAAINEAVGKAKQLHAEAMQEAAGGLNLPGLGDAISKFGGGQ